MLIDWFTVGAQVLNFLVLVWLLKRFLYGPILAAIDAREALIAKKLADAAAKEAEAVRQRDLFERKNDDFERHRADLLAQASKAANAERQRLCDEARKAADSLTAKRDEALQRDARNFNDSLRRQTQEEVFAIARRTLSDLADMDMQARMIDLFLLRLQAIDGKTKAQLAEALAQAGEPAVVRTAFDLPDDQRASIQAGIDAVFGRQSQLRFVTAPDIVSGIELSISGQKLGWSIAEYLAALERNVAALIKPQAESEVVSA